MNRCLCGKMGIFYSSLLEQLFCSNECYEDAYKKYMAEQERLNPTAGDPEVWQSLGM